LVATTLCHLFLRGFGPATQHINRWFVGPSQTVDDPHDSPEDQFIDRLCSRLDNAIRHTPNKSVSQQRRSLFFAEHTDTVPTQHTTVACTILANATPFFLADYPCLFG
jgi:hypothetical protein